MGIIITGLTHWLLFGFDGVKHSEIEDIMERHSPYFHDKQRIWDKFQTLENRDAELMSILRAQEERVRALEMKHLAGDGTR